jgi:AcrR family transcriptional regulator
MKQDQAMTDALKIDVPDIADISPAKRRLLAVAIDLFYEKGFERTTVRDIAARAGILSGSLFHHFRNKQEILFTAMATTTQGTGQSAEKAAEGVPDPVGKLRALILCELSHIHREGEHAAYVLVDEWRSLDPAYRQVVLDLRDASYERCWLEALDECAAKGLLATKPKVARQLIRGATGGTKTWYRPDGELTLAALTEQFLATFLHGPA